MNLKKALKKGLKSVGKTLKKAAPIVAGAVLPGALASAGPTLSTIGAGLGIDPSKGGLQGALTKVQGSLGKPCTNCKTTAPAILSTFEVGPPVAKPASSLPLGLIVLGALGIWLAVGRKA